MLASSAARVPNSRGVAYAMVHGLRSALGAYSSTSFRAVSATLRWNSQQFRDCNTYSRCAKPRQ